jgi:hypothetical protein
MEATPFRVWALGMRGLTETALDEGLRGLTRRPLNNSRISNNTSCGDHDSADGIVVDGSRDSAQGSWWTVARDSAEVA